MESKLLNKTEIASASKADRNDIVFNWMDNPSVQKLLDTIASIIADEYIQIAKQNKDVFEIASVARLASRAKRASLPRNDREFKPYYVAHTKIQTLALLDDKDKVSNWSVWWRRRKSNPRPLASQKQYLHA